MRDYKIYLPHARELEEMRKRDDRFITLVSSSLSVLALVVLVWLVCWAATDSVVKTAEIQQEFYSKPVTATYLKPAAFRLQSPTAEEMDHLHAVQQIAQVRR